MAGLPKAHIAGGVALILVAAWAYFVMSAPEGSTIRSVWQAARPTFVTTSYVGGFVLALALTPLAKAAARSVLDPVCVCGPKFGWSRQCSVCGLGADGPPSPRRRRRGGAAANEPKNDVSETVTAILGAITDWALPVLAIASMARSGSMAHVANKLWGSKGGMLTVWLFEVIARRHAGTSARSSVLLALCFWLYVGKRAKVSLDTSVVNVALSTLWEVQRVFNEAIEGHADSSVYTPALVAGVVTLCVGLVLVDVCIGWHVTRFHPAQLRHSHASYSRAWLWVPTTLVYILAWYLFRPATITSIFICWEQWKRFKQIRTIVPTVVFAAVEVGQVFWGQWIMYRHQQYLNHEPKRVCKGAQPRVCPTNADRFTEVARRNLRMGQYIMLQPGEAAPGTVLLLGLVSRPDDDDVLAADQTIVIDTVAVDGESAGKERVPCAANLVEATVAGLMLTGADSDDHLSRHPCVMRQGAKVAATFPHAVVGRLVGFNAPALLPKPPTLMDVFIQRVGRLGVMMLSLYTALSVAAAIFVYHQQPTRSLVIELFLVNNVALPMTIATCLAMVLQALPFVDNNVPGMAMQAKRAVVSFMERAAKSQASPITRTLPESQGGAARSPLLSICRAQSSSSDVRAFGKSQRRITRTIRGVHLTDKTGTLTRNVMHLYGSIALHAAPVGATNQPTAPFSFVPNDDRSGDYDLVVRLLTAVTANTPRAPNLVPEEQAYSIGLGVTLVSVRADGPSGWQTITYATTGADGTARQHVLRRLYFGLSTQHRCVSALLVEDSTPAHEAGSLRVRLVVQGSPESALGETGMTTLPIRAMPSLVDAGRCLEAAGHGSPAGAQRNWVVSCSDVFSIPKAPATAGVVDVAVADSDSGIEVDRHAQTKPGDAPAKVATPKTVRAFEFMCRRLRDGGGAGAAPQGLPDVEAMAAHDAEEVRDAWLRKVPVLPVRYMLLVDLWRDGVLGVPALIGRRGLAVWMVTGDGYSNARAIAAAIGMHRRAVRVTLRADLRSPTAAAAVLADDILSACGWYGDEAASAATDRATHAIAAATARALQHGPRTLYFGVEEQRLLAQFPKLLPKPLARQVGAVLAAADSNGRPLVHVVAYASETELKGRLVVLVRRLLRVATTFTGDGKNDVRALEQADVSFAFPNLEAGVASPGKPPASQANRQAGAGAGVGAGAGATQGGAASGYTMEHDPEVAAAASAVVSGQFWHTWSIGHAVHNSFSSWAAVLWTRVYITTVLLLLKQGLTAGINVAAAASTAMTENRDPYYPVWYQVFNLVCFAVVIGAGVFTRVSPRLAQPLLSVRVVAATSAAGYAGGIACFALVHWCASLLGPRWSSTVIVSTWSLGLAFVLLVAASAYQCVTRQQRTASGSGEAEVVEVVDSKKLA